MAKIIHQYKYRPKKKKQKSFGKRLFQVNEQFSFWKNYGKY